MVFCGKPSKGCESCRGRKIRCDQGIPSCSQCIKINRKCPGYRSETDVMFRNESENVKRKSKAREVILTERQAALVAKRTLAVQSKSTTGNLQTDDASMQVSKLENASQFPPKESIWSLPLTNEDLATAYFFTNFVLGGSSLDTRLHLCSTMWDQGMESTVFASLNAVGHAGYAQIAGRPDMMKDARKHYAIALRLTNDALTSPVEALKDSTILAIMILGIYEIVTGSNQRSLDSWAQHIAGSATLIKLRGPKQLETPEGLRMFTQVVANLTISCLQRQLPLPPEVLALRAECEKYIEPSDPAWMVQNIAIEFTNMRSKIRDGSLWGFKNILNEALLLDQRMLSVWQVLPPGWDYTTVYTKADPDIIHDGFYHAYRDYWTAQIWNAWRTCRMLLNEVIRNVLLRGFNAGFQDFLTAEYTALYQSATETISQLRKDIFASVPQHTGYISASQQRIYRDMLSQPKPTTHQPDSTSTSTSTSNTPTASVSTERNETRSLWTFAGYLSEATDIASEARRKLPIIRSAGGYFLFWPLFVAGIISTTCEADRLWAANALRHVGRSTGVQQTFTLAAVLEERRHLAEWDAYTAPKPNLPRQNQGFSDHYGVWSTADALYAADSS